MDLSTPVLIIFCRVLFFHALPKSTSTKISCITGISSVYGASSIMEILGFVNEGKTETSLIIRNFNNSWSKSLFLMIVTVYDSLIILPCLSVMVAMFNSDLASFIVKLSIASTSSSNFLAYQL